MTPISLTRSVLAFLFLGAMGSSAIGVSGCSSDETAEGPPDGVACSSSKTATDQASLVSGLDQASPGSCVVVASTITSTSALTVKAGVTLVGSKGSSNSIAFTTAATGDAAITLADGAQLGNLAVLTAPGAGVAIKSPNAKIFDVKVSGAKTAALAISCVDAACAAGTISLDNVTLEKSGYGLWARGAHVVLKNGHVSENGGTSISGGLGIVASDGTRIEMDGTVVEKNQGTGVLLDGTKTTASLKNAVINENAERGVWAQRLNGTIDNPSLKMEGCEISKNTIVGVGGVEARGIIIVGGKVVETKAVPLPTDLKTNEMIGDGIAILAGSTDVKIENTIVEGNARAAGLLDHAEVGIIIVGGINAKVAAPASGFKFVIQNSKADVQIAESDKSTVTQTLGISAPKLNIPGVL